MSRRTPRPVSWYWLAGYVLMDRAQQLVDLGLSEEELQRRFAEECTRLPSADQHRLTNLSYTEAGITAATPDQRAILTTVFQRVLTALRRERPRKRMARR